MYERLPRNAPENFHIKMVLQVAKVFTNHLLAETFASYEELGHRTWMPFKKSLIDEELYSLLRLPTKQVSAVHINTNTDMKVNLV